MVSSKGPQIKRLVKEPLRGRRQTIYRVLLFALLAGCVLVHGSHVFKMLFNLTDRNVILKTNLKGGHSIHFHYEVSQFLPSTIL